MRRRRGTLLVSIAAGLTVLLAIANIVLVEMNRTVQTEVASRNQFIQQSLQVDALKREVVTAVANLAVERNDDDAALVLAAGAALALICAEQGLPISKLALWEPPYIPEGVPRPPADQVEQYETMVAEDRRGDAVCARLRRGAAFRRDR